MSRRLDPSGPSVTVGVRLSPDLLAAVDREVARLRALVPSAIGRSDAVRSLLQQSIAVKAVASVPAVPTSTSPRQRSPRDRSPHVTPAVGDELGPYIHMIPIVEPMTKDFMPVVQEGMNWAAAHQRGGLPAYEKMHGVKRTRNGWVKTSTYNWERPPPLRVPPPTARR